MVVADKTHTFQITGSGDVIEPHDGIIGIGSGGPFALAAARALIDQPGMDAMAIATKSMNMQGRNTSPRFCLTMTASCVVPEITGGCPTTHMLCP